MMKPMTDQMIMMNKPVAYMRRAILILFWLLFLFSGKIFSQNFNGWFGAGIEIDLPKKFTFNTNLEARSHFNDGVMIYQYFPEFELAYKINKRFDVSVNYRLSRNREDNLSFYNRNKFYANLFFDFPVSRCTIKNRARYQIQTKQYINDEFDLIPEEHFRDKVKVSYNIKNNPVDPYLSFEIYYPLNRYKINTIDEYRLAGGIDFPLDKKHDMDIGLMYSKQLFPKPEKAIILVISYQFTVN